MTIRTGIGGWTYPDWRGGMFYPKGLRQADELSYAAQRLGAIEINGTFYRLQKPESFAKWRDDTPPGFVFALKGSRFVTNRKDLSQAGESIDKFVGQGIAELGDRLGPILWQLAKTKRFERDEMAAFLALLPPEVAGLPLRHAIEAGHESFACPEFVELARKARVAIVWSEDDGRVPIADRTAGFAYLRCQKMQPECETGYDRADLDRIAGMCRAWSGGSAPQGLAYAAEPTDSQDYGGDVFAFMINGAKERAPAAAMALAEILEGLQ
ncbi:DUF72 domain-containing protein [Pelagerythrobacter marensis]|uniref:DUF72 domain-containing protein n=1 Tax=Pelagerythrobacter marensis TaxID=543877 RepID=A0A0G3X410_9SPHN|nr:DUF72 domain-containing protein [Pelagerythrobacter marensis]AKM06275.1 hypothetical protein AM2010_186 [Pelagerythrobacter marensis]